RVTAARRPARSRWTRRPLTLGMGLGVLALIAGAWLLFGPRKRNGTGGAGTLAQNRVAVLYFSDLSRDSSLRYLADGLTESLIDQLSAIRALDVVPRHVGAPFSGRVTQRDSIDSPHPAHPLV